MKKDNLYEMDIYLDKAEGKWVIDLHLSKDAVSILSEAKDGNPVVYHPRNVYHGPDDDDDGVETYFKTHTLNGTRIQLPRINIEQQPMPVPTDRDDHDRYGNYRHTPPNPGRDKSFKELIGAELLRKDKINRKSPTRRFVIGPRYKADVADQIVRGFIMYYKRKASNRNLTYKVKGAVEVERDDADG